MSNGENISKIRQQFKNEDFDYFDGIEKKILESAGLLGLNPYEFTGMDSSEIYAEVMKEIKYSKMVMAQIMDALEAPIWKNVASRQEAIQSTVFNKDLDNVPYPEMNFMFAMEKVSKEIGYIYSKAIEADLNKWAKDIYLGNTSLVRKKFIEAAFPEDKEQQSKLILAMEEKGDILDDKIVSRLGEVISSIYGEGMSKFRYEEILPISGEGSNDVDLIWPVISEKISFELKAAH